MASTDFILNHLDEIMLSANSITSVLEDMDISKDDIIDVVMADEVRRRSETEEALLDAVAEAGDADQEVLAPDTLASNPGNLVRETVVLVDGEIRTVRLDEPVVEPDSTATGLETGQEFSDEDALAAERAFVRAEMRRMQQLHDKKLAAARREIAGLREVLTQARGCLAEADATIARLTKELEDARAQTPPPKPPSAKFVIKAFSGEALKRTLSATLSAGLPSSKTIKVGSRMSAFRSLFCMRKPAVAA